MRGTIYNKRAVNVDFNSSKSWLSNAGFQKPAAIHLAKWDKFSISGVALSLASALHWVIYQLHCGPCVVTSSSRTSQTSKPRIQI